MRIKNVYVFNYNKLNVFFTKIQTNKREFLY